MGARKSWQNVKDPHDLDEYIGKSVSPNGKLQTSLFQTCKEEDQSEKFISKVTSYSSMDIENPNFINGYQCDPKVGQYVCSKPEAFSNFQNYGNKVELVYDGTHRFNVLSPITEHYLLDGKNKLLYSMNDPIFRCPNNTFLTYIQMEPIWKQYVVFAVHDGGFYLECSKLKKNNIVKVLSHIGYSDPITPVGTTANKSCPDNHYAIGIKYLKQELDQIQHYWIYATAPSIRLICQEIEVCSYFYNNVRSYLTFQLSKLTLVLSR